MMRLQVVFSYAAAVLIVACAKRQTELQFPPPVAIAEWAAHVDTLPGTYTRVVSPSQFHDSLLIVPDLEERLLWRIHLGERTREPFASKGAGPGEYTRTGGAVRVHADSVAVMRGFANAPFPVIDVASGRGRTHTPAAYLLGSGTEAILLSVTTPIFRQADSLGRLYGVSSYGPPPQNASREQPGTQTVLSESTPIIRYDVRHERVDTVAEYPATVLALLAPGSYDANAPRALSLGPYGAYYSWYVMPDGDLVIVDGATYTVRIIDADTRTEREFSLRFTPIPVSDSGWDAHVKRSTKGRVALLEKTVRDMSAQTGKALPRPTAPQALVPEKPAVLPPVNSGDGMRPMHAAGAELWIPVHRAEPPVTMFYDLVDIERGTRIITLELPANHRLLNVTSLGAYVAVRDEDDLERILLYRRPSK